MCMNTLNINKTNKLYLWDSWVFYLSFVWSIHILICLKILLLLVQNLGGFHPTHATIRRRKARHIWWTRREDGRQGDGESTRGQQHDDDVWADAVGTTHDVRGRDGSRATRATERAIQRQGRVTLFVGLQGRDAAMRYIGRVASYILQSGGYG